MARVRFQGREAQINGARAGNTRVGRDWRHLPAGSRRKGGSIGSSHGLEEAKQCRPRGFVGVVKRGAGMVKVLGGGASSSSLATSAPSAAAVLGALLLLLCLALGSFFFSFPSSSALAAVAVDWGKELWALGFWQRLWFYRRSG
jgi:hypothetical protein